MFEVGLLSLFITMVLILVRLIAGPTLYDRVLAVNTFGTCTVLFIGVSGFLFKRPEFLDIALLYALINFAGTLAILKFFRYRALGDSPNMGPNMGPNIASNISTNDNESREEHLS